MIRITWGFRVCNGINDLCYAMSSDLSHLSNSIIKQIRVDRSRVNNGKAMVILQIYLELFCNSFKITSPC